MNRTGVALVTIIIVCALFATGTLTPDHVRYVARGAVELGSTLIESLVNAYAR